MRALVRIAISIALVSSPAWAASSSSLTAVEVASDRDDRSELVRISGTRTPDFVVFDRSEPFRVVLEWAGSRVADRARVPSGLDGFVRGVRLEQTRAESESISRVIIELAAETRYFVRTSAQSAEVVIAVPSGFRAPPRSAPVPTLAAVKRSITAEAPPLSSELASLAGPLTEPWSEVPSSPPGVIVDPPEPPDDDERGSNPLGMVASPAPDRRTPAPPVVASAPSPRPEPVASEAAVLEAPLSTLPPSSPPPIEPLPDGLPPEGPLDEPRASIPSAPPALPEGLARAREELARRPPSAPSTPMSPYLRDPERDVPRRPIPAAPVALKASLPRPASAAVTSPPEAPPPEAPPPEAPPPEAPPPEAPPPEAPPSSQRLARFAGATRGPPARPAAPSAPAPAASASALEASARTEPVDGTNPADRRLARFRPGAPSSKASVDAAVIPPVSGPPAARSGEDAGAFGGRPRPPRTPDASSASEYDPGRRLLTYIGFRQAGPTSRVFVRIDGRARFRELPSPAADTFVLELLDTWINVENNTRPLDTSFFPGPVTLVQAKPIGTSIHVEVRLREAARWRVKRLGTTVAIDFEAE